MAHGKPAHVLHHHVQPTARRLLYPGGRRLGGQPQAVPGRGGPFGCPQEDRVAQAQGDLGPRRAPLKAIRHGFHRQAHFRGGRRLHLSDADPPVVDDDAEPRYETGLHVSGDLLGMARAVGEDVDLFGIGRLPDHPGGQDARDQLEGLLHVHSIDHATTPCRFCRPCRGRETAPRRPAACQVLAPSHFILHEIRCAAKQVWYNIFIPIVNFS